MPLIKDYRCLFGLVFYHYFPFKMNPGWWCPYGSSFYFYEWGSGSHFYFHAKWIQDEAVDHFPFYNKYLWFSSIKGLLSFITFYSLVFHPLKVYSSGFPPLRIQVMIRQFLFKRNLIQRHYLVLPFYWIIFTRFELFFWVLWS